ncbi:Sec-independent protein translocase protein TatB [Corynebacterium xerosis]|uniref:Sec-independent protein translocase protein TatB n=1 Tax=Corynebacterium xerosis TaxID=1725 RepID=A0A7X9XSY1_9CORY|nr:twin-arginine translocase subunit TatB [Corynebacterium xerosis]
MFSNVGWGEILLLLIVGLVLIGPERLPHIITDVRAMILAARTAIDDAKQTLTGDLGEDFDELRKPLGELSELRKLNPKTALTRTLFDGDDTYLDLLSGKPAAGGGAAEGGASAAGAEAAGAAAGAGAAGAAGAAGIAAANAAKANPGAAQGVAGGNAAGGNQAGGNNGGAGGSAAANPNAGGAQAGGHNWADDDVL